VTPVRVLLVNDLDPGETRAALVHDGTVGEYRCERSADRNLVGHVYKARVVNLERGIGAAFLDLGVGVNGFLHVSDCAEEVERIEDRFGVGDEATVQVTREAVGDKGPVLTEDVSLPGRSLVLLPFAAAGGVSRRIGDGEDRQQLRALLADLEREAGGAVIVRTAAADRTPEELLDDARSLRGRWDAIRARARAAAAPACLYAEDDVILRSLRDWLDDRVGRVVVDTEEAEAAVRAVVGDGRVHRHEDPAPLFHAHGIEAQLDRVVTRWTLLPGGGSIVFDRTEALVAVDVNSGTTREREGFEETALRTNLEACEEAARQLRLRDLGGVVVVDFIDMRDPAGVRQVDERFRACLAADRARIRVGGLGPFALFTLTRQRTGDGVVPDARTTAYRVLREVRARVAAGEKRLLAGVADEVRGPLLRLLVQADLADHVSVVAASGQDPRGWAVDRG